MKNVDDDDWEKKLGYTQISKIAYLFDGIEEIGKEACYQFLFYFLGEK